MNRAVRVIFLFILATPLCYSHASELKIDLSQQVQRETKVAINDLKSKKQMALRLLSYLNEYENLSLWNRFDFKINGYRYENNSLFVTIGATVNEENSQRERLAIDSILQISGNAIVDKINLYSSRTSSQSSDMKFAGLAQLRDIQRLSWKALHLIAVDGNGREVSTTPFPTALPNQVQEKFRSDRWGSYSWDFQLSLSMSRQSAVSVKSLRIEARDIAEPRQFSRWLKDRIPSIDSLNLIQSLNSSNPLDAYESARDSLIENIIDFWRGYNSNYGHLSQEVHNYFATILIYFIEKAAIADAYVIYSFAENIGDTETAALVSDHKNPFSFSRISNIFTGKEQFVAKRQAASKTGCERFIPSDFKYASPIGNFGVTVNPTVGAMFSQLGILNDSSVLGEPDGKIRVIVGPIEALTPNGGIIRTTGRLVDEKPIIFSRTSASIIINPERITVGGTMIRVIGVYENNGKVQLSNRLGSIRSVDAINLSVVCMEPLMSNVDLLRLLFSE